MRSAFISVIGEHHPRRLSNFATIVFVIKASFSCVETPCSATVFTAWLVACAAFVEGGYHACFFFLIPTISPLPGYYACFFFLIPTISPLPEYYACFFSLIPIVSPPPGYHACFFSHIPTTTILLKKGAELMLDSLKFKSIR